MAHNNNLPPLRTWPPEAFEYEPAHGFLVRLAERNSAHSTRAFADLVGLNGIEFDMKEVLSFCLEFPIRYADRFKAATPIVQGRFISVNGLKFSHRRDWSITRPRVCDACLGEQHYYRNWWDLTVIGRCPIHDRPLLDGAGTSKLQWWIPSVGLTPSGQFLSVKGIERISEPRDTWDAYVLGRMGIIPSKKITSLDETEMYAVVEAAELIGRAEESGWRARWPRAPKRHSDERRAALARGFQVLRREEEGIREFLDRYLRQVPQFQPSGRRLRIKDLYGWLARASTAQVSASPVQTLIRQTMAIFAAERGIFDHKRKRVVISNVNCPITLKEMAVKHQVSRHTLRRVIKKLGFTGIKTYRNVQLFSPSDVDKIKSTLDNLIPRKKAAEMLGLTIKEFGQIVDSALVTPFVRIYGHTLMNDQFLYGDLEKLIEPDLSSILSRSPEAGIPLLSYCKIMKQSVGEAIQQIQAGAIKLVDWNKDAVGLNRYLLPKPSLSACCRITETPPKSDKSGNEHAALRRYRDRDRTIGPLARAPISCRWPTCCGH